MAGQSSRVSLTPSMMLQTIYANSKYPLYKSVELEKRAKGILLTLKSYLSKIGLITWSPEQLQSWLERQEKKQLGKSQKIRRKQIKELKGQIQYTNKMKGQTKTSREAPGVRPQLGTQTANQGRLQQVTQPKSGNCQVLRRTTQFPYEIFSHTTYSMWQMSEIIQENQITQNSHISGPYEYSSRRSLSHFAGKTQYSNYAHIPKSIYKF